MREANKAITEGFKAMTKERTLSIIKPDATARKLTDKIIPYFEKRGLRVTAKKSLHLSDAQAKDFYSVHKERPFYGELVAYMTSGPVDVLVLEGENAVTLNREIMGATNPANAAPGTIRKDFGESIERNSVHGSDSRENADREIQFFFNDLKVAV